MSSKLAEFEVIAQSWFEDDPQLAQSRSAPAVVIALNLLPIYSRASLPDIVTDGLTLFCVLLYGCVRRLRLPFYTGANSR
jgi:hypothetical protein